MLHFRKRARPTRGSRPPPPTTIGLVFAEPEAQELSVQLAANLAVWCASMGLEYIYMYDPSGQLRQTSGFLSDLLKQHPEGGSLSFELRVGWPGLEACAQHFHQQGDPLEQLLLNNGAAASSERTTQAGGERGNLPGPVGAQLLSQRQQAAGLHLGLEEKGLAGAPEEAVEPVHTEVGPAEAAVEMAAAAAAAAPGECKPVANERLASSRRAVTVHLLAADDSYSPVVTAALRCQASSAGGGGARGPEAAPDSTAAIKAGAPGADRGGGSPPQSSLAAEGEPSTCKLCPPTCGGGGEATQQQVQKQPPPSPPPQQQPQQPPLQQQQTSHQDVKAAVYGDLAASAGPEILREPELLLVFGPVLTLAGYPPFHARSCQIYHVGPARGATAHGVREALARYGRTLQRHGK